MDAIALVCFNIVQAILLNPNQNPGYLLSKKMIKTSNIVKILKANTEIDIPKIISFAVCQVPSGKLPP
jgi:hypothetical protein